MENQIYRLYGSDKSQLEFIIVDTNEVEPTKDIKEINIDFLKGEDAYHFNMDLASAKSLVKYLEESIDYVEDFNSKQSPKQ